MAEPKKEVEFDVMPFVEQFLELYGCWLEVRNVIGKDVSTAYKQLEKIFTMQNMACLAESHKALVEKTAKENERRRKIQADLVRGNQNLETINRDLSKERDYYKQLAEMWDRACHDIKAVYKGPEGDPPITYSAAVAFAHEYITAIKPAMCGQRFYVGTKGHIQDELTCNLPVGHEGEHRHYNTPKELDEHCRKGLEAVANAIADVEDQKFLEAIEQQAGKLPPLERKSDPYAKRHGPRVEVTYSCMGCLHHRFEDGHGGRRYLCAVPTIVEQYGEPQYTCTSNASAPLNLCPYRVS